MPTKAEQSDITRRALLAAARRLFAEHGFADTPTAAIVDAAGVTRGALYHHFRDKTALFQAVYEDLEREVVARVMDVTEGEANPLTVLRRGADAFLDACLDPAVQRVVLLEGPSVLGWELWREIDQEYGLGMVRAALQLAVDAGAVRPAPVEALSHVLFGGLVEAAMLLTGPGAAARRAEVGQAVTLVIDGLQVTDGARRPRARGRA